MRGFLSAVAIALVAGCGSSPRIGPPADEGGAGTGPPDAATPRAEAGPEGPVASNGVPIPPADPATTCGGLGFEVKPCAPMTGLCDPISSCACLQTVYPSTCVSGWCATSVACPTTVTCADAQAQVFRCVNDGLCKDNWECVSRNCVRAPGQTLGSCSAGRRDAICYVDSDCFQGACVFDAHGKHACAERGIGDRCNRNEQCASGRCLLAPGEFAGFCTDGAVDSPCLTASDCSADLHCAPTRAVAVCTDGAHLSPCASTADCIGAFRCVASQGVCSAGGRGAPCDTNDDCPGAFCVDHSCDTGEVGARCHAADQCKGPFCISMKCSDGQAGAPCFDAANCVSGKCSGNALTQGMCTDGKLGQACAYSAQCAAGSRCSSERGGTCGPLLPAGAPCQNGTDCESQRCIIANPMVSPVATCAAS